METISSLRAISALMVPTLAFGAGLVGLARADSATEFRSGENQTHLLELFSSEGCSSCPPADAWLATLRGSPDLWKQVVPVEFHVDYWNRLGWTDQLSKIVFTERQQSYAREWANANVYTPGFVLDGAEWRPAGNAAPLASKASNRVGVLSAKKTGRRSFYISFDALKDLSSVRVYGALLANGLESKVNSGENAGSVLKHEFAVLALVEKPMAGDHRHYAVAIELPSQTKVLAKSYSAAFWVSSGGRQAPLQAVGGDLD